MPVPPPWDIDAQPPDIAVLVVLAEEFEILSQRYGSNWYARRNETYGGYDYFWLDEPSGYRCVASFSGRMSPEEAVQLANRLFVHGCATIVNLGIAAGLHGDIKIGDVVVPDLVVAYDKTAKVVGKRGPDGRELQDEWRFERRSDNFRPTHVLVEEAKSLAFAHRIAIDRWRARGRAEFQAISSCSAETRDTVIDLLGRRNPVLCAEPSVHVETLASGHTVVTSEAFVRWVRDGNGDIKALEMEAAGMLLAAAKRADGPQTLVIRGISDHVEIAKAQTEAIEAGALRRLAMRNALGVFELMMELGVFLRVAARATAGGSVELDALQSELQRREAAGEDVTELREAVRGTRRLLREGLGLRVGEELAGRYRLDALAGTGGFASVWKAWDARAKTMVAVKVLHRQWVADRSRVERFTGGARQMAKLDHPGITRVLALVAEHEAQPFFVMPYMARGDLFRAIKEQRITTAEALRALARVAEAIDYAHLHGVIHRDIKPQNILIDGEGHAALADFDLVHAVDSTHGTRTGALGTYIYSAPEQLEDASKPDAKVDVYALGMTILYCLLGRNPAPMIADRRPKELQELGCSEALARAVRRAVACDPNERALNCSELARVLGEPDEPQVSGVRSAKVVGLGLAGVLGVVGVSLVVNGFRSEAVAPAVSEPAELALPKPEPAKPEPAKSLDEPAKSEPAKSLDEPSPKCTPGKPCHGGLCDAEGACIDLVVLGLASIPGGTLDRIDLADFWIDATEVTVADYERCVKARHCEARSNIVSEGITHDDDAAECNWNRSRSDHPMNCISASDADSYCDWRGSEFTVPGWEWSLPTELQWRWAAMGGSQSWRVYPFEGEPSSTKVNACGPECVEYRQRVEGAQVGLAPMYDIADGWPTTAPIRSTPQGSTSQGVADLAGNVWEWTESRGSKKNTRVTRGGGWRSDNPAHLSLAEGRGEVLSTQRVSFIGFRCVLTQAR